MPSRSRRSVAEIGQVRSSGRRHVALILAVPVVSLVVPAVAVDIASAGGTGLLTRAAAELARFLLFYSGVFALVALTAAVAAGLLATDRIVMSPERRILAQATHRTMSLVGISALANHIMLEVLAHRAGITDGFIPFMASRNTFFMGLGTVASDLFVVIIVTGILRRRFSARAGRQVWRGLHMTAYAAWPMAILHGLLAGRSAKPYVDWSYGACLAAVALALVIRSIAVIRGRNAGLWPGVRHRPPGIPGATFLPRAAANPGHHESAAIFPEGTAGSMRILPPRRPGLPSAAWEPPGYWAPAEDWAPHQNWAPQQNWTPDQNWAPDQNWVPHQNWTPSEDWTPDQYWAPTEDRAPDGIRTPDGIWAPPDAWTDEGAG